MRNESFDSRSGYHLRCLKVPAEPVYMFSQFDNELRKDKTVKEVMLYSYNNLTKELRTEHTHS